MQIPPFPLPSNVSTSIHFRVPDVNDGLLFCDLNDFQEEANTTRYLNHMQDTSKHKLNDSGEWTGEDRRTALWWIYVSTNDQATVPFSYKCKCGETHYLDVDMRDLMETSTALLSLPKDKVSISIRGIKHQVLVNPLNGYAVEHIEMLRNVRDEFEPGTTEYKKASNDMAFNELAHHLTFDNQPEGENAQEWKLEKLKTMYLNTEFRQLMVVVEKRLRESRHGVLSKYDDGKYFLVAKVNECEELVKKGGAVTKTLLLPFHHNYYIATF